MKPPRLSGPALVAARIAAETPGTDAAIREVLRRGLGIGELAKLPEMWRGAVPTDTRPVQARPATARSAEAPISARRPGPSAWPRAGSAYAAAYRDGSTTPRRVIERALTELEALTRRKPNMNILVASDRGSSLRDADAATARIREGRTLGPLDGVPFLVKDEFDVEGLPTRLGSPCEPDAPAERDSTVVARLRRAGAVFAGKTVCTEWGMSPIGASAHGPMPHNAFDPTRAPGGSSTGSGVGVALGLSPLATGGDGGGSIRIPAALNGVFGIKPTFGRVSRAGDGFKGSVAHAGPLACSVADLVLFLDAVATERDALDALTDWAPPPPAGGFGAYVGAGVRGLRIGVDEAEWADATPEVARAGRQALATLERDGATLVPVKLPLARHAASIGYLTIAPESLAANRSHWLQRRDEIGDDVRLTFAVIAGMSAFEVFDAMRLRSGLRREVAAALREVDVLALPTTAITAPRYEERDEKTCFSDPASIEGLCRYTFLGNLTGLPAGTAPVGVDGAGLPVGLQIVGDAWDEATVLYVLAHLEASGAAVVRRPPIAVDLLG